MPFPTLIPTSRQFDAGDFPVKTYKAQSGAEVRILYGTDRTSMTLSLSFANITDANAQLFIDHETLPVIIRDAGKVEAKRRVSSVGPCRITA